MLDDHYLQLWAQTYRRPKTGMGLTNKCVQFNVHLQFNVQLSRGIKTATFEIGRLYVPLDVFTVTTRTISSDPGCTAITRAIGHFVGRLLVSCTITISPIAMFLEGECHLLHLLRVWRYSVCQRCQKCLTNYWQRCQCFRSDTHL